MHNDGSLLREVSEIVHISQRTSEALLNNGAYYYAQNKPFIGEQEEALTRDEIFDRLNIVESNVSILEIAVPAKPYRRGDRSYRMIPLRRFNLDDPELLFSKRDTELRTLRGGKLGITLSVYFDN